MQGDVEKVLPEILNKIENKPEVVFVYSPKKRTRQQNNRSPKRTNPKKNNLHKLQPSNTCKRLRTTREEKYDIQEIQPVDMFL